MDADRHLGVKLIGVFAAPGVVVPVDHRARVYPSPTLRAVPLPLQRGGAWIVFVEQEGGAVVATPGIVAGDEVQEDVLHVGADGLQLCADMVGHCLVVDVDMHLLTLGQGLDKEMVGRIDGLYLPRP